MTAGALSAMANHAAHDEDSLGREDEGEGGDIAEHVVMALVRCLADAGPAGVHLLRKFTQALEEMADATLERNHGALEDAASDAHEVLAKLIED
jgi:hypothetical protein